jgi:hypothetical protein
LRNTEDILKINITRTLGVNNMSPTKKEDDMGPGPQPVDDPSDDWSKNVDKIPK